MNDIWIVMEKYTGNFCGAFTDKKQAKVKCGKVMSIMYYFIGILKDRWK